MPKRVRRAFVQWGVKYDWSSRKRVAPKKSVAFEVFPKHRELSRTRPKRGKKR